MAAEHVYNCLFITALLSAGTLPWDILFFSSPTTDGPGGLELEVILVSLQQKIAFKRQDVISARFLAVYLGERHLERLEKIFTHVRGGGGEKVSH